MRYTIDASVFISAFILSEPQHQVSRACLDQLVQNQATIFCPTLALVETASAIARVTGDEKHAIAFASALANFPNMELIALDEMLAQKAVSCGAMAKLRGADAVYAAVAEDASCLLITWDKELLLRAKSIVQTCTPETFSI